MSEQMTFGEAVSALLIGGKLTRVAWKSEDTYLVMRESFLKIHNPDGKFYDLIVHEEDLRAEDWVVVE
jgi:hypothetical protein